MNTIEDLVYWLRDKHRVKKGVDYAILCKYGEIHIICHPIWERYIVKGLKKFDLKADIYHIAGVKYVCPTCNGNGVDGTLGDVFECGECNGNGMIVS